MKKKTIIILAAALLFAAAAVYVGVRLHNRGTDIIGVTTLPDRNTVIVNAKTGKEFVSGSGKLTVGAGEHIHLEYALTAGSFDLAFHEGSDGLDVFRNADLENLPSTGEVFGKSDLSGSGSLDFEAADGEYTVYYNNHGAIGTAKITASGK